MSTLILPSSAFFHSCPLHSILYKSARESLSKFNSHHVSLMLKALQWPLLHLESNCPRDTQSGPQIPFWFLSLSCSLPVSVSLLPLKHIKRFPISPASVIPFTWEAQVIDSFLTRSYCDLCPNVILQRSSLTTLSTTAPQSTQSLTTSLRALVDTATCLCIVHVYWFTLFAV